MSDLRARISRWQRKKNEKLSSKEGLDYYGSRVGFIDDYRVETDDGEVLVGDKIFLAVGARPRIPSIDGIDELDYLTNESILELESLPERLVIVGGGYIGVEYGHFMSRMGSDVTIIQRGDRLVKSQDWDVSNFLQEKLSESMGIVMNTEVTNVEKEGSEYIIKTESKEGERSVCSGDEILIATGRVPNTDILSIGGTDVDTDERGFIEVNEYFETSQDDVWAVGDVIGKALFKHAANVEAKIAWNNSKRGQKESLDYGSNPKAVFTDPEIGSVGLTEREALDKYDVLVGKASYKEIDKGRMIGGEGFAKSIVDSGTRKLLGFHIIGPDASNILQEAVNVMRNGRTVDEVLNSVHTYPTLCRIVPLSLKKLEPVENS